MAAGTHPSLGKAAGRIHRPDHVMYWDISRDGRDAPRQGAAHHGRPHGYSKTPMKLSSGVSSFYTGTMAAWGIGDTDLGVHGDAPFMSTYKGKYLPEDC